MIYLDNAATTRMFEKGVDIYKEYACQSFFNPSASYKKAINVFKQLDMVRQNILNKLGAREGNIVFTSGATESNNLAIMGSKRNGKWEYIFSEGDHPSVYNTAKELCQQGHVVHFVGLQKDGQVDYEELQSLLNEKTRLVSLIHVSNETGVVNDIALVNRLRKKLAPNSLLHVDGVQAFCKLSINIEELGADFYTISAHKFHGPKGVGCLYCRKLGNLKSIVFGGGQEGGYRSGTENVPGIMAMNYAVENIDIERNYNFVHSLKQHMIAILNEEQGIRLNKNDSQESPYILSVSFEGVNGETLMRELQDNGVIVGMGSACSAKKAGNRILESMGKSKEEVKSYLRLSFSEFLSKEDIEVAGKIIVETYQKLKERVK